MKATLTFGLDVPSVQKATAIREKCAAWLDADPDVAVISSNSGTDELPFTVVGAIRGRPDDTWREVVHAPTGTEAKAKALAEDKQRTVTAVMSGEVGVLA